MIADLIATLLPEAILVAFGCVALLATRSRTAVAAAGAGLGLSFVATASTWVGGPRIGFGATVVVDASAIAFVTLFLVAAAVAIALAARAGEARPELCALMLFTTAGLGLAVSAADLAALVAGIEVGSVSLSAALAVGAQDARSREAATKHSLAGSVALALTVAGAGSLAALTGASRLADIAEVAPFVLAGRGGPFFVAGVVALAGGLLVRAAVAPFHLWLPDAVDGAPRAAAGMLAVAAPVAALVALSHVLALGVPGLARALVVAGVLSAVWGSFAAMTGRSAVRALAYLAVASAGWLLVAAASGVPFAPLVMEFAAPALGALAALAVLGVAGVDDLRGLARRSPLAGLATAVFVFGLGGFPPAGGLIARASILAGLARDGAVATACVLGVASVASAFACARIVGAMYAGEAAGDGERPAVGRVASATLVLTAAATLLAGIAPEPAALYTEAPRHAARTTEAERGG